MKSIKLIPIAIVLLFYGCIGTDIVDEFEVPIALSISRTVDSIQVGETFAFQADYFNNFGQIESVPLTWESSDPTIISIDAEGVASALLEGNVYIRAVFSTVKDSVKVGSGIMVEEELAQRNGVFRGNRDYAVNGAFTLTEVENSLALAFDVDFTASNGPGLYVYLTNSSSSISGGLEVGKLQKNSGAQVYNLPAGSAQLNTYSHILIYCKPFGIAFGVGTFVN